MHLRSIGLRTDDIPAIMHRTIPGCHERLHRLAVADLSLMPAGGGVDPPAHPVSHGRADARPHPPAHGTPARPAKNGEAAS